MRVGHEQPAVAVDRQAARPVDVEVGRPPAAEVLAVAVEDLDPVGQVGEVEVVLGVERGDPRLVQPARLRPVDPPDQVRAPSVAWTSQPAGAIASRPTPTRPRPDQLRVATCHARITTLDPEAAMRTGSWEVPCESSVECTWSAEPRTQVLGFLVSRPSSGRGDGLGWPIGAASAGSTRWSRGAGRAGRGLAACASRSSATAGRSSPCSVAARTPAARSARAGSRRARPSARSTAGGSGCATAAARPSAGARVHRFPARSGTARSGSGLIGPIR